MTDKELKRLNRLELMEILKIQAAQIEALEKENRLLKEKLENKRINIETSGSLAEACLKLNQIFEAAQAAADQYMENVKAKAAEWQIGGPGVAHADEEEARPEVSETDEGQPDDLSMGQAFEEESKPEMSEISETDEGQPDNLNMGKASEEEAKPGISEIYEGQPGAPGAEVKDEEKSEGKPARKRWSERLRERETTRDAEAGAEADGKH